MPAIALAAMKRKQRRHACGGSVRYQVRTIDSARTASRTRRNSGSGEMHMVRYVSRKASQFSDCPDFRVSASPDIAVPAAAFASISKVDAAGGKHNRPSMSSPKRHSRAAFAYTRRQGRIDAMYVCGHAGPTDRSAFFDERQLIISGRTHSASRTCAIRPPIVSVTFDQCGSH
jgi:hypothetical protein